MEDCKYKEWGCGCVADADGTVVRRCRHHNRMMLRTWISTHDIDDVIGARELHDTNTWVLRPRGDVYDLEYEIEDGGASGVAVYGVMPAGKHPRAIELSRGDAIMIMMRCFENLYLDGWRDWRHFRPCPPN